MADFGQEYCQVPAQSFGFAYAEVYTAAVVFEVGFPFPLEPWLLLQVR